MKKLFLIILIAGGFVSNVYAQWSTSGNNIFPTTLSRNVGVGLNSPQSRLDVFGTFRLTSDGTYFGPALSFGFFSGNVNESATRNFTTGDRRNIEIRNGWGAWRMVAGGDFNIVNWNGSAYYDALFIKSTNGNIGIGTVTPAKRLEVNNSLRLNNGGTTQKGTLDFGLSDVVFENNPNGNNAGEFLIKNYNGTGYNTSLFIKGDGNIGIGTVTPDFKLTVNGKIKAEEVQVVVDVPADYVFEEDYYLRPLHEVETYIKAHKHLPGIPSADEIKEQGWQVGEMNNLLLEKVEELTLYMIELKKENESMREEMKQLKAQIDRE